MKTANKNLGNLITALIKKSGRCRADICKEAGISISTLHRIEGNNPKCRQKNILSVLNILESTSKESLSDESFNNIKPMTLKKLGTWGGKKRRIN